MLNFTINFALYAWAVIGLISGVKALEKVRWRQWAKDLEAHAKQIGAQTVKAQKAKA